jgi:hypothetical protein
MLRGRIIGARFVFNEAMRSLLAILAAALVGAALLPAAAGATTRELGFTTIPAVPSCPASPCLAVTKTTGFQLSARTLRDRFKVVGVTGRVTALTVRLGHPTASQVNFFNTQAGGTPRVRVSVLRPVAAVRTGVPRYVLNAQSTDFFLTPYFGRTAQFPLYTSLLVRPNYVVAVTTTTWAPILAVSGLDNTFSWRSSRVAPCSTNPENQPPHTLAGSARDYFCTYRPAQLAYSATVVSTP